MPSIVNPGPMRPNIKVSYCNAQGFILGSSMSSNRPIFQTNKLLEFQSSLHIDKPDIAIVNETWLNKHIHSNEIVNDEYYKCFRVDRSESDKLKYDKKGGAGVMILCKNELSVNFRQISTVRTRLPILAIEAKFPDKTKLCICTYYRYGYTDIPDTLEAERYFKDLAIRYKDIVLVGDLNMGSIEDWTCPIGQTEKEEIMTTLFNELSLSAFVHSSTHRGGNTLDQVLSNKPGFIHNVTVIPNGLCSSDHYTINFELRCPRKCKPKVKRRVFAYKKANWNAINNSLINTNWNVLLNSPDVTQNLDRFKSTLDITIRQHIPMVNVSSKGQPPWFDSEVREMRDRKLIMKRQAESVNATRDDIDSYKNIQSTYKKFVMNKKQDFITKVDPTVEASAVINKRFWSHIKKSTNCSRIPDTVHHNGRFRSEAPDKCEMYNQFFCAQFSEASDYSIEIDDLDNPLCDLYISPSDVFKILSKINPHKATGPDGIDGHVLKKCAGTIHIPLAILFNQSYQSGKIPQEWRNANVVPIHKKKDKSNVENYRPISLTCLIMKVFEKSIRSKLLELCHNKITDKQHGFLPAKSCNTQMLYYTTELSLNLNSRLQTDVIYYDFAKAFDSVSHDLVLAKLKQKFSINGKLLRFVRSYLKDRQQRVAIDGSFSSWQPVRSGVPQGSVVGPVLFVLFINDIVNEVSPDTNVLLYADDMKIWRTIESQSDGLSLQAEINSLLQWSIDNKMKFHPSKCKVIRSTMKREPINCQYTMNGIDLELSDSEKDLGILVNSKLSFRAHRNLILARASHKLGLVKRNCSLTGCPLRRKVLYLTLVRSLFEHCSNVWGPTNEAQLTGFVKIQKRAIKWVLNEPFASYSNKEYHDKLKSLNVLPMKYKFQLNDIVMFHKIYYKYSVVSLPRFLARHDDDNDGTYFQRHTRAHNPTDTLKLKCKIIPRINVFRDGYFHRAFTLWNSLPLGIRSIECTNSFKNKLKEFLWLTAEQVFNN